MSSRFARTETGMGASFIASAVIHLAVFLLLAWLAYLPPRQLAIQETYYVDVVNLPVVSPRSGNFAQKPDETEAVNPPVVPPVMTVPLSPKAASKSMAKPVKPAAPQVSAETESSFAERIAKLERSSEARREEAVLEKLRSNVKTGGSHKVGAPGASGAEAGSRYADFIKSRLEDALEITSSYNTKQPEVSVRLTIAPDGRLLGVKVESSSGDATFELAVRRAIDLASRKFTAPPGRTVFDSGFVFRPKGITNRMSQ